MSAVPEQTKSAQERFKEKYITAPEVCEFVGVSRATLMNARRRGLLPDPVDLHSKLFMWEREPVMPYLEAWKLMLNVRRGASA